MTDRCPRGFDEHQITGYLDGELTQAAEQRVRIHLEDCQHCRSVHDRLAAVREVTMGTEIEIDQRLDRGEAPHGTASRLSRGLGWAVAVTWVIVTGGYGLWLVARGVQSPFERLLVFGGLAALALLLLSVVIDRVRELKHDRYRGVDR
jgi:anti-sigma factor RsiW